MQMPAILRLSILLAAMSAATVAAAKNPPFQKIHEGKHWTWYARQDQFNEPQSRHRGPV